MRYFCYDFVVLVFYISSISAEFEPYELNGDLCAAVSGKGYAVIASDTRLSRDYEILSRSHVNSRIWRVSSDYGNDVCDLSIDEPLSVPNVFDGAFVASSGCLADCDALKRLLQSEVAAHSSWSSSIARNLLDGNKYCLNAASVSNVLGSTLYRRRSQPFYSFCITAGIDEATKLGNVHIYDAIGSHEQVAVAAVGSGREMLQPVLDRLFATSNLLEENAVFDEIRRDGSSVHVEKQRIGLMLSPPVRTYVDCDVDEAIELLVRGFRSVGERDINVGDQIVVCVLQSGENGKLPQQGTISLRKFPLKRH